MALTNDQITAQNFKDFYNHIMPYLNGQPALNYSTDEQVVGTWIDGKPLYQKTYDFGDVTLTTDTEVKIQVEDSSVCPYVDRIIEWKGSSSNRGMLNNYTNVTSVASSWTVGYVTVDNVKKWQLSGTRKMPTSLEYEDVYVTIRYTKTTD